MWTSLLNCTEKYNAAVRAQGDAERHLARCKVKVKKWAWLWGQAKYGSQPAGTRPTKQPQGETHDATATIDTD